MPDTLLLRLPREASDLASWMVADAAGNMLVPPQSGALVQAAPMAGGRRVVALVPAADVLLTEAELPVKGGTRLQQVVPFALEEQLADDVENLHFAVGRRAPGSTRTPIAVVAKSLLREWLGALQEAGLAPAALHADAALLPANPGQLVALVEHEQVLARAPEAVPVSLPAEELAAALELAQPVLRAGDDAVGPAPGLLLYATPADWERRGGEVDRLRERFPSVKVQLLPAGPLPLLAQQLPALQAVNLLQGPYAPKSEGVAGWRAWRVAAILFVALIGLHVAGKAYELTRLQRLERELDAATEEVLRTAMPGVQPGSDVRRQVEERLLAVRSGAASTGGLLPALSALARAHGGAAEMAIESLNFARGSLELKVRAPDAASVDRINQQLRAAGWQSELTAGNASPEGYEGRIQISTAGS